MKKQGFRKFSLIVLAIVFSFGMTQFSLALGYGLEDAAKKADYDISGKTDVYSIVGTSIQAILAVLTILFFIYITYAGFLWMRARGNETLVTEAKDMILGAVIGLAIIMAAYGLTTFVMSQLNG